MKRDPYFDVLKFVAMFLVVFGHTYWALGCKAGMPYFENFRCGMNMPLFFMVSGYFSAQTINECSWRSLGRHLVNYFWPLAIVSCLFAVLTVTFGLNGCDKGVVGYAGRRFLFASWFLWCLAICLVMTFLCCRVKSVLLMCACFLGVIFILPFVEHGWQVANVRAMLPHFLFGVFILKRWRIWERWKIGLPCLVCFVAVVILQGDILVNGLSFYLAKTTWQVLLADRYALPLYGVRILNGVMGSVGVMWLVYVLTNRFKVLERFAPLGTTSLGVYILHQWLLALFQGMVSSGLIETCALAGLLFAVTHTFVLYSRKVRWIRCLLWGNFNFDRRAS